MVAGLNHTDIIATRVIEDSFTYETFWAFIFDDLVPNMPENAVLILDNCRIHHNVEMRDILELYGIEVESH
jgi:hypothetical protein